MHLFNPDLLLSRREPVNERYAPNDLSRGLAWSDPSSDRIFPVSSSGHLVIGQHLLGVEPSGGALFEVALHVGTLLSIFVVLRADVFALIKGLFDADSRGEQWQQEMRFILLGMIPAGVIGALFKDELESAFSHLWSVGLALVFYKCYIA